MGGAEENAVKVVNRGKERLIQKAYHKRGC